MKLTIKYFLTALISSMLFWSCSEASGHGSVTMVLSGSVHGQLDPCG